MAYDICIVVDYMLHDPTNYAIHVPGRNQDIALRAARPDSHNHISDIATVVRWVLFVTQFNEENGSATLEGRRAQIAAKRVAELFDSPLSSRCSTGRRLVMQRSPGPP